MRYEAKHKYFKKIAGVLGNFKNVQKTVAFRHQRAICHKMSCTPNFLQETVAYGTGMYEGCAPNMLIDKILSSVVAVKPAVVSDLDYAELLEANRGIAAGSTIYRYCL